LEPGRRLNGGWEAAERLADRGELGYRRLAVRAAGEMSAEVVGLGGIEFAQQPARDFGMGELGPAFRRHRYPRLASSARSARMP
jgi:hypothetical protein